MKIQPYVQKLQSSPVYRDFQGKFKDAFLVAGFFVIDFETGSNVHQIDYYVPSKKKFAAFTLDKAVQMQLMTAMDKRTPEQLDIKTNIDLDALQGIIQDEMKNRSITQSIKKMIAVIQNQKGQKVWNINCILSGMDILRVHIDDNSRTVLKMDRASLMEYMKRIPGLKGVSPEEAAKQSEPSKEDIAKKIEQLDKLKQALQKEEVELEKQTPQKDKAPSVAKASSKSVSKKSER
ncbi:MAG TPA: hypothetical protein VJK07_01085 [Candidatus Nanoarchaeia archaeon]|nr:hypothetical protein [Candidatus Nanoarchaeia archaeon]